MFHIAICDDEQFFRLREKELIEEYMKNHEYSCQIDLYPSGKDMLNEISNSLSYDIIFLDINMEELDGIETAGRIRMLSTSVYIVFVTAYISYALEGYKVGAVRYLLKEEESLENALKECLNAVVFQLDYREQIYRLKLPNGNRDIPAKSILYIESRLHKVIYFVMDNEIKEYSRYDKLDTVEAELKPYGFCRTHQSFLVNMSHVMGVDRYKATLREEIEVPISKKYYKNVETRFIREQGKI